MAYSNYKQKNWKTPTPSAASGSKRPSVDGNMNRVAKQPVIKTRHDSGVTKQVGPTTVGTSQAMGVLKKQKDNVVKKSPVNPGKSAAGVISTIKKKRSKGGDFAYYSKGKGNKRSAKKGVPGKTSNATSTFGVNGTKFGQDHGTTIK